MDFETMMGPIIYQDIPSSFGRNPMTSMGYCGMYPYVQQRGLKPVLADDKFEKAYKNDKTKKNVLKTIAVLAGIALTGVVLKKTKILSKLFPNGIKTPIKNAFGKLKAGATKIWNGIKNFFHKTPQPAQPTP